jgi:hypothetical protein
MLQAAVTWLLEQRMPQPPQLAVSLVKGMVRQVPSEPARAQLRQDWVQAALQQTPSAQKPLRQSPGRLQVWPVFFWHWPPAEQLWLPVQLSGSGAPTTLAQVPAAPVHASQVRQELAAQHLPSTQKPLAHWAASVQALPGAWNIWQRPPPQ